MRAELLGRIHDEKCRGLLGRQEHGATALANSPISQITIQVQRFGLVTSLAPRLLDLRTILLQGGKVD